MPQERIQKILARAGFGSRRDCEVYLRDGRVTVNGVRVGLGDKADAERDQILLDGKQVSASQEKIYIAINKPRQVLSAIHQDDDRKDVLDLVPIRAHLFPVGRLDYDSEGLLLLTNDGDFANRLSHPRYEHEKEYIVQIGRRPEEEQLNIWRRGIVLEDGYRTAPARIDLIEAHANSAVLRIVLKEGRKRQIRESGERIGLPVERIKRVRIGKILLGDLKPGEWRYLTRLEVASMSSSSGSQPVRKPVWKSDTEKGSVRKPGQRESRSGVARRSSSVRSQNGDRSHLERDHNRGKTAQNENKPNR